MFGGGVPVHGAPKHDGSVSVAIMNTGSFVGNGSAGRQIGHSSGVKPKRVQVFSVSAGAAVAFTWIQGMGATWQGDDGNKYNMGAEPDATYFSVGVAATFEGNVNLINYVWVSEY